MKYSIILLGFMVGALARPEPPVPSGSYLPSQLSSSYGSPSVSYAAPSSAYGAPSGGVSLNGFSGGYSDGGLSGGFLGGLSGGGFSGGLSGGGYAGGYSQDQKHVYFYAAPDDEGPAHLRVYIEPSHHRNTKVIFVKAPSYGGVIPEVIAPPSQAEDRTKVYVLVKKPEHGGAITVPSSLGVKSAKPEIFFIKYNNQHDAAAAVQQGLAGGHVGAHLENLGNEQTFVRSLESGRGGFGGGFGGAIGGGFGGGYSGGVGGGYSGGVGGGYSGSLGGGYSGGGGGYASGSVGSGYSLASSSLSGSYGAPAVAAKTTYGPPGESGPYKKK